MNQDQDQLILLCNLTYTEVPYWYGAARRPLHLDIVCPRSKKKQPTLLWFCGGAFQQTDHHIWLPDLIWYAQHGWTVVSAEYRVGVTGAWPACLDDAWAAVAYLKSHADDFGIDPDLISVIGESAGGYIAAGLGLGIRKHDDLPQPVAAVDLYGVTDLYAMDQFENAHHLHSIAAWMGGAADDVPERYQAADPISNVHPGAASFMILHGTGDQRVPWIVSKHFYEALIARGVSAKLLLIDGAAHGDSRIYHTEVKEKILAFLNEVSSKGL